MRMRDVHGEEFEITMNRTDMWAGVNLYLEIESQDEPGHGVIMILSMRQAKDFFTMIQNEVERVWLTDLESRK